MRDRISGNRQSRQLKDRRASAAQVTGAGTMSVALKKRGSEALGEPTEGEHYCAVGWLESSNRSMRRRARQ